MAKLIGTAPNQIPTNADLGTMAFQDVNAPTIGAWASQITETTNVRPSLSIDFANGQAFDPRLNFSRNSRATFFDRTGKLMMVGGNQPRIDYDPVTRECKGLLVEESRTNCVTYSTLQSNYTIGSNTTDLGAVTGPDGSTGTARRFRSVGASNNYTNVPVVIGATGTYCLSIWVRLNAGNPNTSQSFYFQPPIAQGGNTGVPLTGQWTRIWWTINLTSTGSTNVALPYYDNAAGVEIDYAWFQVELGSFPTSYIETSGGTTTRGQDFATITDIRWFINQSPDYIGTLYGAYTPYPVARSQDFLNFNGGTNNTYNRLEVGDNFVYYEPNGANGASGLMITNISAPLANGNVTVRCAAAMDSSTNDIGFAGNGILGVLSSSANAKPYMSKPTQLHLGYLSGYSNLTCNGWIRKVQYYPARLSNAELVEMTK